MNNTTPQSQPGERLPHMNRDYLTFDENNRPHPKTEEVFYEAIEAELAVDFEAVSLSP